MHKDNPRLISNFTEKFRFIRSVTGDIPDFPWNIDEVIFVLANNVAERRCTRFERDRFYKRPALTRKTWFLEKTFSSSCILFTIQQFANSVSRKRFFLINTRVHQVPWFVRGDHQSAISHTPPHITRCFTRFTPRRKLKTAGQFPYLQSFPTLVQFSSIINQYFFKVI